MGILATGTAYSNQRKLDRCQDGTLWTAPNWSDTSSRLYYSKDNGVTWIYSTLSIDGAANFSFFIDLDDYMHVVWKQTGTLGGRTDGYIYYMRGTPNAGRTSWTWSAATQLYADANYNYPDIIAHREGTGWKAHIISSYANTTPYNTASYDRFNITSGAVITLDVSTNLNPTGYAVNVHTFPSIDFNHTGDGKTVAGSTPHIYAAWSAGTTGAGKGIRFRKAVYAAGVWTWNTERELDNTLWVGANATDWISCLFDGTRVMVGLQGRDSGNNLLRLIERDAADTTTTIYASENVNTGVGWLATGSMSYDANGNFYLFGAESFGRDLVYRKFTRSAGTLGPHVVIGTSSQTITPYVSAKRGYSNGRIEWIYTTGNNSPYAVKYDYIGVGQQGSASGDVTSGASVNGTITRYGSNTATAQTAASVAGSLQANGTATGLIASGASVTGLRYITSSVTITLKSRLSANWSPVTSWTSPVEVVGIWTPAGLVETTWDR